MGEHIDGKESLSGLPETTEKASQATMSCLATLQDSKMSIKLLSPSRRSSEVGSVADCSTTQFETPSVPLVLNMPASPSEMRSGKRVRKLKKRKVLKKAQGTEQPESSDTELDVEASRPRWPRPRRRPSGGSQVSTPALFREGAMTMEGATEACVRLFPGVKLERLDTESLKQMVFPQVTPAELTATLDSEDSMEVTAACQQPNVQVPDSSRPEPPSLACNEVTSTSDMEICKSSER